MLLKYFKILFQICSTRAAVMAAITTLFVSLASAHAERDTGVTDIAADQVSYEVFSLRIYVRQSNP